MNKKAKKQEQAVLDCYVNLPTDEKLPFVEMIEFIAAHPGSGGLLREAWTRGHRHISEIFAYLQDNWIDPEPAH